jgi:exopolyphosphatase / guanosine-5'-triphosphate,3'-diphosphate pyrophosphatase
VTGETAEPAVDPATTPANSPAPARLTAQRAQAIASNPMPAAPSAALAAFDLGTNSTRVLVGRSDGDGAVTALARENTITRLGQGVDGTGRLAPEAIQRTVDCVRSYLPLLDESGVTRDPGDQGWP